MDFAIVDSLFGLSLFAFLVTIYVRSAALSPLGALSLPCMTMATVFIYFYVMPVVTLAAGDPGYLGITLGNMSWGYFALLLYCIGASLAFAMSSNALNANPAAPSDSDRPMDLRVLFSLWGLGLLGVVVQIALGRFNPLGSADVILTGDGNELRFVNLAFSLLVPVAVLTLIRFNFNLLSVLALVFVTFILLQVGFRYRIVILLAAAVSAFALLRGFRIGIVSGVLGSVAGVFLVNLVGAMRKYGQGLQLQNLEGVDVGSFGTRFSGEIGILYVLDYVTSNPLPPPAWIDPWVVAIAGFIPSAIWPDKPRPDYLAHIVTGANVERAELYGIAASQQVEFLLQAGWWGVLPLAFLYFLLFGKLVHRIAARGREARIAAYCIAPTFFGFYMQSRGYLFQIIADFVFMLLPLAFVSRWGRVRRSPGARSRALRSTHALQRRSTTSASDAFDRRSGNGG